MTWADIYLADQLVGVSLEKMVTRFLRFKDYWILNTI